MKTLIRILALVMATVFPLIGQTVYQNVQQASGTYTDNAVVRRDGTANRVQNSDVTISDASGNVVTFSSTAGNALTFATASANKDITLTPHGSGNVVISPATVSTVAYYDANKALTSKTPTQVLDLLGSTQGQILYRNATTWVPLTAGVSGQFLQTQGAGANPQWSTPAGAGDFVGPASSTDNAIVRFDSTTGKLGQNSAAFVNDAGSLIAADYLIGGTVAAPGPSVSSSLGARGPRQALVHDGTYASTITGVPALGTSDCTLALWVNQPDSAQRIYFSGGTTFIGNRASGSGLFFTRGAEDMEFTDAIPTIGKTQLIVFSRSEGTTTPYIDGKAYTPIVAAVDMQALTSFASQGSQTGSQPLILNRAMTAAEVKTLWETGRPASADYNSASNTNVIPSTGENPAAFGTDTPAQTYWNVASTPASTISSGTCTIGAGGYILKANIMAGSTLGQKWRATLTGTGTFEILNGGGGPFTPAATITVSGSTGSVEFTLEATGGTSDDFLVFSTAGGTLTAVSLVPLGLLLDLDWDGAGAGGTVAARPGTSATLTLPASGVSYALPRNTITLGPSAALATTIAGTSTGGLTIATATNQSVVITTGTGITRAAGTSTATNTVTGGFVVGDGATAGTNVAIGGGKIFTGGDVTVGGDLILNDAYRRVGRVPSAGLYSGYNLFYDTGDARFEHQATGALGGIYGHPLGVSIYTGTSQTAGTAATERVSVDTAGNVSILTGTLTASGTGTHTFSGNVITDTIGKTFAVKSGTDAKAGTFTLVAGAATVSNTSVTANSVIIVTLKTVGGTRAGNPDIVPTASTGFTATGAGTDTSTYNYVIVEVN